MRDRVGEEFSAIVLNATRYGLFVELDDLFVEGLVPVASLEVILDRIDTSENKLQFSVIEATLLSERSEKRSTSKPRGAAAVKKQRKKLKKSKRDKRKRV